MHETRKRIIENQYKILSVIKKGGFGTVYLGWDLLLEKPIAIKEILPEHLHEVKMVDMFHDEAINTAKLNHPNIVQIYNLKKTDDGTFYIIMEYIDGVDLNKLIGKLKEEKVGLKTCLRVHIIEQISLALDYAHNFADPVTKKPMNMIHRDVSPSNIMVTSTGVVKLIDFGIAKAKFRKSEETQLGILKGKVPYMSPEQVRGGTDIDHRSDLFSLGVCFYELMTGKKPFAGKSEFSLMQAVLKAKINMDDLSKTCPPEIVHIISKALQRNREKRYPSAHEMQSDISEYMLSQRARNVTKELKEFVCAVFGEELKREYSARIGPMPASPDVETRVLTDSCGSMEETIVQTSVSGGMPISDETVLLTETPLSIRLGAARDGKGIRSQEKRDGKRKRRLIAICAFTGLLFVLAGVMVFGNGRHVLGRWVASIIHPFSIVIDSNPRGAEILIDNAKTGFVTPHAFAGLAKGHHAIELRHAGFKPILLDHTVNSRIRGRKTISAAFSSTLRLESYPRNAIVVIGEQRLSNRTPCSYQYKVGDTLSIRMELMHHEALGPFNLVISDESARGLKSKVWKLSKTEAAGIEEFVLKGWFQEQVAIHSTPDGAAIDLDGEAVPLARTNCTVQMAVGEHTIGLEKNGFVRTTHKVNVDGNARRFTFLLAKRVMIKSHGIGDGSGKDLNARIAWARSETGETISIGWDTPVEWNFPCQPYRLFFTKKGYRDTSIVLGAGSTEVVAFLRRESVKFKIVAEDAEGFPIPNCRIGYRDMAAGDYLTLGRTDKNGVLNGILPTGNYLFSADKPGYRRKAGIPIDIVFSQLNKTVIPLEKQ